MGIRRSSLISKAKKNLSESEIRKRDALIKEQSHQWRNFWVQVLKRQGYSNVVIANDFEISESTVRSILK